MANARLSSLPLPASRYVPGSQPRSLRPQEPVSWDALDRAELARYAIDLFNARYHWEAHEAWEKLWRSSARGSPEFMALKALIQIAAALLKVQIGNEPAARRLAARGVALLRAAAAQLESLHGLRLESVARTAQARLLDPPGPLSLAQGAFELTPEAE